MPEKLPLHIPVENQVRELDAKLLLAVLAALAGYRCYLGYRTEMDIKISSLPRGIYLAKSFTPRSDKMFKILSKLGHIICAWDEEALVHYPADIYFNRRVSATSLSYVSHLFAWGEENEQLFRAYPQLPKDLLIHQVGNPRLDLLRKDFIQLYNHEVDVIKNKFGDFILINTNFGNVNAHLPIHNLFLNRDANGNYADMGKGAVGMGYEFASGRANYKQTIFDTFIELIEYLGQELPTTTIVIRPHPVENQETYLSLASKHSNIQVVREGNVIPWIHAAKLLIHSGCTTGIEAYLSNKTAIAYVPTEDDRYGYDAILPNRLSIQCQSKQQVLAAIKDISQKRQELSETNIIHDYINLDEAQLSCTNIINKLDEISTTQHTSHTLSSRTHGWYLANKRKLIKRAKSLAINSKYNKAFQEVRFPTQDVSSLQDKSDLFATIIGAKRTPTIKTVSPHIFLVE